MTTLKHYSLSEAEDIIAAGVELMDASEGVLLDDMIGENEAGQLVLFKVCFVSCWASDYTIKISESDEDRAELWREWEAITAYT